jgi:hypothetical protein
VADSTCLACYTAALYLTDNVELFCCLCESERLTNEELECLKTEIVVNFSVVDDDFACAGIYTNTSY